MIPRLQRDLLGRHQEHYPFTELVTGESWRPVCFVVDTSASADEDAWSILASFARAGKVDLLGLGLTHEVGTAIELPAVPDGYAPRFPDDTLTVTYTGPQSGWFGIRGVAGSLRRGREYADQHGIGAADAERAVLLLTAGDQHRECEGLVSSDPLVSALAARDSKLFTFEEAVALLGLQRRLAGDFSLGQSGPHFDSGMFYWVLAPELLPAAWRTFTACLASARKSGDAELEAIALMPVARLDRALRSRDRFHGYANRQHDRGVTDETLFFFETSLLYLSAAFDATARIAHRVYGIAGDPRFGWRSTRWRALVGKQHQELATFMEPGSMGGAAFAAVQIPRNTIHGEGLMVIRQSSGPSLVEVPTADVADLRRAIGVLGDDDHWGLAGTARVLHLESQLYLERVFDEGVRALNRILELMDIERLPHWNSADAVRCGT
jgi:hypothetical protein